jgi:phage gpG-like protein
MAVAGGFRSSFALDTSSFMAGIRRAKAEYERRARQAINLGVMLFEREVKKELSKPGTGRLYKRRRRRGRGQFHRASAEGHPPASDMGILRSSITHLVERELLAWVGQVGTDAPYARILEFGGYTGRGGATFIAARPFILTTLERIRPQLLIIFAATLGG